MAYVRLWQLVAWGLYIRFFLAVGQLAFEGSRSVDMITLSVICREWNWLQFSTVHDLAGIPTFSKISSLVDIQTAVQILRRFSWIPPSLFILAESYKNQREPSAF